jgi:hypothetical protein
MSGQGKRAEEGNDDLENHALHNKSSADTSPRAQHYALAA